MMMESIEVLDQKNRVTLQQLWDEDDDAAKKTHLGKFLLVRTVSPVDDNNLEGDVDRILVAVTDPETSKKTNLILINYSSAIWDYLGPKGRSLCLEDVLPTGTYLAVKNPNPTKHGYFQNIRLIWDNPTEVRLLSEKDVKAIMGQDFKWSLLNEKDIPHSFWTSQTEDSVFFHKLRLCGNKLFGSGCYSDAIRFYDLALQYASTDVEKSITLSNKAAALLRFNCNRAALTNASLAVDLDAGNRKAVYRLAQAHVGLGKFDKAVDELESKLGALGLAEVAETGVLKEMLEKARNCNNTPPEPDVYLALAAHQLRIKKADPAYIQQLTDNISEFVGPVEIRTWERGHGLFATEDISPGQIILVSRALAFHTCEELLYNKFRKEPPANPCLTHLLTLLAHKIYFDHSLGSSIYRLSAGQKLGCLREDDPSSSLVDMNRIEGVLLLNPLVGRAPYGDSCGFWSLPSFINHSCSESNCSKEVFKDVIIVQVLTMISKGDELLWPYVPQSLPYREREPRLRRILGFPCPCKLCAWETKEKDSPVGLRREKIAYLLMKSYGVFGNVFSDKDLRTVLSELDFMQGLWNELKLPDLLDNNGQMSLLLHLENTPELLDDEARIKMSHKIATLCRSSARHGTERIVALYNIHKSYVARKTVCYEMVCNVRELKKEFQLWFGSVDGIRFFHTEFVKNLKNETKELDLEGLEKFNGIGIDYYTI